MRRPRYDTVYARLVANTRLPEDPNAQSCWCWTCRKDKEGYGRVTFYVPGLMTNVTLQAHVVMAILLKDITEANDLFLAALELRHSGLEVDHLCHVPSCINPDHLDLDPLTPKENSARRRSKGRYEVPTPDWF